MLREYPWLDGVLLAVLEGGKAYEIYWDHIMHPAMAASAIGAMV